MSVFTRLSLAGCILLCSAGLYFIQMPPSETETIPIISLRPTESHSFEVEVFHASSLESSIRMSRLFSAPYPPPPPPDPLPEPEPIEEEVPEPEPIPEPVVEPEPLLSSGIDFITELSEPGGKRLFFFKNIRTGRFYRVGIGDSDGSFILENVSPESFLYTMQGVDYVLFR